MELNTEYLGLPLKNPLIASASPLTHTVDGVRQLEDAGAAAVVLSSLFAEQILMAEPPSERGYGRNDPTLGYFPRWDRDPVGPDGYLDLIRTAKRAVGIPVIGSLNGAAPGAWTRYARLIEEAGADALELNLYYLPASIHQSGAAVEQMQLDLVDEVRRGTKLPLAVKIGPHYSSIPHMAERLVAAGADGLVLFNRFYQPDFDLESRRVGPHLVLSDQHDLRLPLRWIGLLYGQVPADLALTSGVHSHEDVAKAILAGAAAVMMASELLQNGVGRVGEILRATGTWVEQHRFRSLDVMRGQMSARYIADPTAYERGGYTKVVTSLTPVQPRPLHPLPEP